MLGVMLRPRSIQFSAWHVYALLGLAATAAYFLVPRGGRAEAAIYQVAAMGAMVGIVVGVVVRRPRARLGWLLLAAGVGLFVAAESYCDYYQWFLGTEAPFPSVADALFLCGYPFLAAGIVLLFQWPRRSPSGDVFDAAVLSAGAGALVWFVLVQPALNESGTDTLGHIVSAAYPMMDLLVLAVIVYAALAAAHWTGPLRLLAAGMALYLLADLAYVRGSIDGTYSDGSWMDGGWLLAYIAIGAAGLHPAIGAELVAGSSARHHVVRWRRFATVAGVALLIPAVRLYALVMHRDAPNDALIGFSVGITVLAFARVAVLLHDQNTQERELRRGEAERARLLERTLEVAEEERSSVARDLHDGPIQALTAIALKLDLLAGRAARAGAAHAPLAAEIREDVAVEVASLRRLMAGLRPPVLDEKGLAAALDDCASVVFNGSGIDCTVRGELNGAKLAREFETAVYRIAREVLLNARKHSSAHTVEVVLERTGDALRLAIEDDGVGFDVRRQETNGHAGLLGIRELVATMGGSWSLEAAPGFGTRIAATLPWKDARVD